MGLNDRLDELTRVEVDEISVVVADTDPGRYRDLIEKLEAEGMTVHIFTDGDAVCEHLRTTTHAVLISSDLPPTAGLEVIARGRRISPSTSFLYLSKRVSMQEAIDAIRNGALDYLPSPLPNLDVAYARVRAGVERSLARHKSRILAKRLADACTRLLTTAGELQTVKKDRRLGLTAELVERLHWAYERAQKMELELQAVYMGLQPAGSPELVDARKAADQAIERTRALRHTLETLWTTS